MRLGKAFFTIIALLLPSSAWAGTCGNGYAHAYRLVVPAATVKTVSASDLSSQVWQFQFNGAAVNSQPLAALKSVGNGGLVNNTAANSKGFVGFADGIVCDSPSGGNAVKFEVEGGYSTTTGSALIDVFFSTLSVSVDNDRWLFLGNNSVSTSQQDLSLWTDAGFFLVCHHNDGSTLSVVCSLNSGTETNHGATASSIVLLRNGGGSSYSSAGSQYIDTGKTQNFTNFSFTMFWNNPGGAFNAIVSNADAGEANGFISLYENSLNQFEVAYRNGGGFTRRRGGTPTSAMTHVGAVHTAGSANLKLLINGVPTGSLTETGATDPGNTGQPFVFGRDGAASAGYNNAQFDEFRGSTNVRSDAEIAVESFNLTSASFVVQDTQTPSGTLSGAQCVAIQINHGMVSTNDQTNFQINYHGYYPFMADTGHGGLALSANNITWWADSGCSTTPLTFQRHYWINTTGENRFTIFKSSVSHTVDGFIYQRIGYSGDTADLSTNATWSPYYVSAYNFGSPYSISTADDGSANLDLSNSVTGSGCTSFLTLVGGGAFTPNDSTSSCGNDPGGSDHLGAHGVPIGSAARTVTVYAQANINSCALAGTGSTTPMAYGKANGTGMIGPQFYCNASVDVVAGFDTMQLDSAGPGVFCAASGSCTPLVNIANDFRIHRYDLVIGGGAQLNASTLLVDGSPVSNQTYNSPTSTLNTADGTGASGVVAEYRLGRCASHGACWWTGQVANWRVSTAQLTNDRILTEFNTDTRPWDFYTITTATPFSGGGGSSTQQLIPGIITQLKKDDGLGRLAFRTGNGKGFQHRVVQ
jgi:hypothetical protein